MNVATARALARTLDAAADAAEAAGVDEVSLATSLDSEIEVALGELKAAINAGG